MRLTPKIRWSLIGIVALICLFVAGRAVHLGPRLHLGYQADGILDGATRVETFRVMSEIEVHSPEQGHSPRTFSPTAVKVDHCYVTATGKEQGPQFAKEIAAILLDEGTYTHDTLSCITLPGVVFRIWKGSQSLDVVLCFHCGEMYTITRAANGKETPGVYTLMAGDSRTKFARLAKQAFPSDPEIQAL